MTSMPLSKAQAALDAAAAKAKQIGQPMNIAVVDDGGGDPLVEHLKGVG